MYRVLHTDGEIYSYDNVAEMMDGVDDAGYLLLENLGEQDFIALMEMWVSLHSGEFDTWWDASHDLHRQRCAELSKIAVALIESASDGVTLQ